MKTEMQLKARTAILRFIASEFPALDPDWWEHRVLPYIERWHHERAWRMGPRYLDQMDLAAALRVLWRNWQDIADWYGLPDRYRGVLGHLHMGRNHQEHPTQHSCDESNSYDQKAVDLLVGLLGNLRRDNDAVA